MKKQTTIVIFVIVIAIVSAVAVAVLPLFGNVGSVIAPRREAEIKHAKAQLEALNAALKSYYLDVGSYPSQDDGLMNLIEDQKKPNWQGPYIHAKLIPLDPWGREYYYGKDGDRMILRSDGPRPENTKDDITLTVVEHD